MSSHLANIPEAVRIAASVDPNVDAALKQQAIEYLQKVKELCEETWQDCLALYLQGAGASGPGARGKNGKEKQPTELRMFCQQVVDTVLTTKPERTGAEQQQAMYTALVDFVKDEWVEGPCEGNQPFLRNKLAFTLAQLFIVSYPAPLATFLHPFLSLQPPDPSSSKQNFHPVFLTLRILSELALEIHDSTIKSARPFSAARTARDGVIRDSIRKIGDERLVLQTLLSLAERGLEQAAAGGTEQAKWIEMATQAMKTLATWTPWIDLTTALTPESYAFYLRVLRQPVISVRIPTVSVLRSFTSKGRQDPSEKLQVLSVLDIVTILDPLETETRDKKDDADVTAFRAAIGGLLAAYGTELAEMVDDVDLSEDMRNEAQNRLNSALPLILRFLSDRDPDISLSVGPIVSCVLRLYKKWHTVKNVPRTAGNMPPPPSPPLPLTEDRRKFLSALLDISVRQLAWPDDAEWEPPNSQEPDVDDESARFQAMRTACRSYIESISAVDKSLHTEIIASIVVGTLDTLQASGPSAVSWQQAELAMHLVYTFGELNKANTRAAFYDVPAEMTSMRSEKARIGSENEASMASGRTTPTSNDGMGEDRDRLAIKIDYSSFPLTVLGRLLTLCITSGIANYPHPSVTLQYFEIGVRYVEFWRSKEGAVSPILEAMIDQRGIHHPDDLVRRRCYYLFSKLVASSRSDIAAELVPPILDSMRDVMVVKAELPERDNPDEDLLVKATTGQTYLQDQLHLFAAAGGLVYSTKDNAEQQLALLEAVVSPLMNSIVEGLRRANEPQAVLQVHHNLLALGHFAKGFPSAGGPTARDLLLESMPYQPAFKQMTEMLLQAVDGMKTQRIVRDSARFAFSQFVAAIGSSIAELVPRFVSAVVTEFEPTELIDFITFLGLLMHRLKSNTFETMDMLLLPLLSRIFAVLQSPITGTDDVTTHTRLKEAYLQFFTSLMNANLDGVFISERNKPEFENLLQALIAQAKGHSDQGSQRIALAFFGKSMIAWGSSSEAANQPSVFTDSAKSEISKQVANGTAVATNQHAISKGDRAKQALPGYETFIYQSILPLCFDIPADEKFVFRSGRPVLFEIANTLRNAVQARGQEALDCISNELLPKYGCPPEMIGKLIESIRTQQSKDFRKTFVDFIKAMKS